MSLSMYQASIPVFIRMLGNLSAILGKAAAHVETKKIDPAVFINARLAPDMYPLSRQVQIATDVVKGCAARLAGIEVPSYEDNESTFPELQARIAKTVAFLQSVSAEQINGSEERTVSLIMHGKDTVFLGQSYLLNFVLPNFYFHITTATDPSASTFYKAKGSVATVKGEGRGINSLYSFPVYPPSFLYLML